MVCAGAQVTMTRSQIARLVLGVQADTAQWSAHTFQTQPFAKADKLVCTFAEQATDAYNDTSGPPF